MKQNEFWGIWHIRYNEIKTSQRNIVTVYNAKKAKGICWGSYGFSLNQRQITPKKVNDDYIEINQME